MQEKNGWGEKCYDYIVYLKNFPLITFKYSIATSSCTGALHLVLSALNIKKKDEIIIPDINWVAVASSIKCVGATPIFADIERDTWCIDPVSLEKNITKNKSCNKYTYTEIYVR